MNNGNVANGISRNKLTRVVMPIIRAMRDGEMSWAQLEECADVLRNVTTHHQSMVDEQNMLTQAECQKQQGPCA